MINAITAAGPTYRPPGESVIRGRLLDEAFEVTDLATKARIDAHSQKGHGMTISSDGCTITKEPPTNYIAKYPNEPGILLGYEDSTELYQSGGIKDTETVYEGLRDVIENIGPSNVTAVVLDNAPVMVAAMQLLMIRFVHLFVLGCLAHKVNTFVKHLIRDIPEIENLVEKTKEIVHHFNEKHKPRALLSFHLMDHIKTDLAFIIPADTRFGLYLLMLHRVYLMRAGLQSCVKSPEHIAFCESGDVNDDLVVDLICDDSYWDRLLNF
jgi:Protein of unknown function (DUF 659)